MAEKKLKTYLAGVAALSAGGAILAATGVGLPAAAFIGGYQIGTGLGLIGASFFQSRAAGGDPNYSQPVQVESMRIRLPEILTREPEEIAAPASAALVGLGSFVPNMRALKVAIPRYEAALAARDRRSWQMQLDTVYVTYTAAKMALTNMSVNLGDLGVGLRRHPAGQMVFDMAAITKEFQDNLAVSGIPEFERPYLAQFAATPAEEAELVSTFMSVTPAEVVETYGSSTSFADFIKQLGTETKELADELDAVVELPSRR